jgi:nucleoside-diphosphate-sugar epimerase
LGKIELQHFVYVGSMSVFGMLPKDDIVNECSEKVADSIYASNKIEATRLVLSSNAQFLKTVCHPTGVYDANGKRIKSYQDLLRYNYIVTLKGGMGINNIVHADDVAIALIECLHRPKTNESEEYVINGESIIYNEWFRLIEKTVGVENKRLAPQIFKPLYLILARKLLQFIGFRCPIDLPYYKLLIFENKAILSSLKADKDFSFKPTKTFRDVCNQICMEKISKSKDFSC